MKLRFADAAVFVIVSAVTAVCALRVYGGGRDRARLHIQGTGGNWVYPMDRTERVEIPGPLGQTVVELSGGGVRVLSSPCANKTCIASGTIHRRGQWIACLPNGISLTIEGENTEPDLDAAAF
ncbi:MAG: NusG domain II-containing protein [Treponema sp.]|nr:NusG domain II-containing protein [Treponema sp.]